MSISAAEYQRRLKTVNKITVLRDLANKVIMEEEVAIGEMKKQDFLHGDIYGNDIRIGYQSAAYAAFKSSLNPLAGGAVDLILTGNFVDAMLIKKPIQNRYSFFSTDWKNDILARKYGKEIFGLNQDKFDQFQINILAPKFIQSIKETAGIA